MFGTYLRLKLHVTASSLQVCRKARQRLKQEVRNGGPHDLRQSRKCYYREMLRCHGESRKLVLACGGQNVASSSV